MSGLADNFFGLLTGFAYLHIGLAGVVGIFLTGLVSAIVWWTRAEFPKGLPGAFIVVILPMLMLGIIPGLERVAAPLGVIAALAVALLHYRRWQSPGPAKIDGTITILTALSLAAIALAFVLGSLSNVGG